MLLWYGDTVLWDRLISRPHTVVIDPEQAVSDPPFLSTRGVATSYLPVSSCFLTPQVTHLSALCTLSP